MYQILQDFAGGVIGAVIGAGTAYLLLVYLRLHAARRLVDSLTPAQVKQRLDAFAGAVGALPAPPEEAPSYPAPARPPVM